MAAGWAGVLVVVWMLFVGQWTVTNWVAGALVAVVGAGCALLVIERGLLDYTFRRRWLATLPSVGRQILVDLWIITRELAVCVVTGRHTRGRFVGRPLDTGGDTPLGASWRAFVSLTATWSPNAYVVDVDRERNQRLVHDLVVDRASERPA